MARKEVTDVSFPVEKEEDSAPGGNWMQQEDKDPTGGWMEKRGGALLMTSFILKYTRKFITSNNYYENVCW